VGREADRGAELSVAEDADPDLALIAAVASGDQRALAQLVRRHGPRLRALASGYSAAAADADDVVQETFFTVWRTAGRFEPRGVKVGSWITRIAVNRCIDLDRRRRLRRLVGLDDAAEVRDRAVDADRDLDGRRTLAAVADDIRALPARQRAAILLAADGEKSNAEIADALGVTLGAAEQLLVRARRTLRDKLAAREGGGPP
jgi:RNA polymerase sigma-70 factor (ECF subfamily)